MPGLVDQTTVDRIREANTITDVVSEYVSLIKKGREMVGVCPFHDDHSPSMNVSESKQIFKCFACGAAAVR
jgi:DNA primase